MIQSKDSAEVVEYASLSDHENNMIIEYQIQDLNDLTFQILDNTHQHNHSIIHYYNQQGYILAT
jgi:hypothetical protein